MNTLIGKKITVLTGQASIEGIVKTVGRKYIVSPKNSMVIFQNSDIHTIIGTTVYLKDAPNITVTK